MNSHQHRKQQRALRGVALDLMYQWLRALEQIEAGETTLQETKEQVIMLIDTLEE